MIKKLRQRIYNDFFMPDRFDVYTNLVKGYKDAGFEILSVRSFWERIQSNQVDAKQRYLIMRHDVDVDAQAARQLYLIEQSLGASSSFYFRQCTVDVELMKEMEANGFEASYHYEELASYVKEQKIKSKDVALSHAEQIRCIFAENLETLRAKTQLPMTTVAAHGDFANRKLGVCNLEVLQDEPEFRKRLNISLEAYDKPYWDYLDARYCDRGYPVYWSPSDPLDSVKNQEHRVIEILTHPGRWGRNAMNRLKFNAVRAIEGVKYAV